MIIYCAKNIITGAVYIGQTRLSLRHRRQNHERSAVMSYGKLKTGGRSYFHGALRKYGFDNFEWSAIDTARSLEELDNKEIEWIKHFKSNIKGTGYNLNEGGRSPRPTMKTRKKISKAKKGQHAGNKHPLWRDDLDVSKIIELRNDGMSLVKIASMMNCSRRAIENRLGRGTKKDLTKKNTLKSIRGRGATIQYVRPKLRAVSAQDITKFISEGGSIKNACEHFGIGQTTLYRRLQEANE